MPAIPHGSRVTTTSNISIWSGWLCGLLAGRGQVEEATALFQRAIAAKPDLPQASYGLALMLARGGDRDAALSTLDACFAQPLAADPRNTPVYGEARRLYIAGAFERIRMESENRAAGVNRLFRTRRTSRRRSLIKIYQTVVGVQQIVGKLTQFAGVWTTRVQWLSIP